MKPRLIPSAIPVLALLAAGCGPPEVGYLWSEPTAGGAGGNAAVSCAGTCAKLPPWGWERDHVLLWTGAKADAPPCPANASTPYLTGYADLIASGGCDACTCNDPACVLPGGLIASSSSCAGSPPNPMYSSVDAPPAWDGACTSTGNLAVKDAASMQIAAPTVTACTPITAAVAAKFDPPFWGKYVLTCQGIAYGRCEDSGSSCVPAPDVGFRLCIERSGMPAEQESDACPDGFPERHRIYESFTDQRSCTPCACDSPTGSECAALVSTYTDASCTTPIGSLAVSHEPGCFDDVTGMGVASMAATWISNTPGKCKPTGGDIVGEIVSVPSSLFCCQPLQ
ncbi:MAG: hypothetical protein ABJE95_20495 [Byssovorax sp.]